MLQDYAAIFKDAEGDLEDELDRDLADETVHSLLLYLCLAGLFNGTEPILSAGLEENSWRRIS